MHSKAGQDALAWVFLILYIRAQAEGTIKPTESEVSLAASLEFPSKVSDIVRRKWRRTNSEYRTDQPSPSCIRRDPWYWSRNECSPFHTRAGLNVISSFLIPNEWRNRMKRNKHQSLQTATKETLPLKELILLHLHVRDLKSQIWFEMAPSLAVDTLLSTSFIDRFTRGNLHAEREVVL